MKGVIAVCGITPYNGQMPYARKLSEETDVARIEKRRQANRKKQRDWATKNPIKVSQKRARWRKNRKEWVTEFNRSLKKNCASCGNNDVRVLEFHHIDPKQKDGLVRSFSSKRRILAEVDKCIVLCANCHAIEHSKTGGYHAAKRS